MKHKEITEKVIGSAMKVHSNLGNGFQEVIYQRALAIEMEYNGLKFKGEKEMPIYYREHRIGTRRVDFFVEDLIMVEIKVQTFPEYNNNHIEKDTFNNINYPLILLSFLQKMDSPVKPV